MADDQVVSLHRAGDRRQPGRLLSILDLEVQGEGRGRDHRPVRCSSTISPEKRVRRKERRPRPSLVYRPALVFRPDREGARRRGADQECRVAAAAQQGRGGKATRGGSGALPKAGAAPRARRALDPRTAVARRRVLLARPPAARRSACPGARPPQRPAAGLALERGRELPDAAGAVPRPALCQGAGALLHLRPAGVPLWLAPRFCRRRPHEPRAVARALRRGVEVLERAGGGSCAAPRSTTACRCSRCGASARTLPGHIWGAPNLQVVNRAAHVAKCSAETAERARLQAAAQLPAAPTA